MTRPRTRTTTAVRGDRAGPAGGVRGLLALVTLLALVVGIPVGLLVVGSTSHLGEFAEISRLLGALSAPDDGSLFLGVLALVAWIGWATFAMAVLMEVPAQLRGVPTVRLRGLAIQQSLAGGLVAAALAVIVVPGAANAAERPVRGSLASSRPPAAAPHVAAAAQEVTAERRIDTTAVPGRIGSGYEVRRGDTLWDIAADRLGDGSQWRRIAQLNYDRAQPDGGHLDRSHRLQPGWRLVLPEPDGQQPHAEGEHAHVVQAGETLSGVARGGLGSADRGPEILEAGSSPVQPGGGRAGRAPAARGPEPLGGIPSLLRRGGGGRTAADRFPPGGGAGPPADGASTGPVRAAVAPSGRDGDEAAAPRGTEDAVHGEGLDPSWSDAPEPSRSKASTTPPSGHSGRASVAARPAPAVPPADDEDASGELAEVRTVGGVGGLLAACLVALVGARRVRQQRRRRPGQRIPLPPPSVLATEARLRAVADVAGVAHIDLALRALASEHRSDGRPL